MNHLLHIGIGRQVNFFNSQQFFIILDGLLNDTTYCNALIKTTSNWYSRPCNETKPFICKLPEVAPPSNCPYSWNYYEETNSCYKVRKIS